MDSATKFRRAEIELIKKNLEKQLVHYYETSAKFKRWHTRCQTVCAFTGGVATILTGSGLAASLSAVGVAVGGPLIATATLFSLVSTSCMVTIKFFLRKAKKHEKIQTLAEATLSTINSLISTALEDGVISDGEYQDIVKKYNTFTTAKTKLRFSNHTDSGVNPTPHGVKVNRTSKTTAV